MKWKGVWQEVFLLAKPLLFLEAYELLYCFEEDDCCCGGFAEVELGWDYLGDIAWC